MNRIFCFIFHSRAVFSGLTSFRGTSMQVSDILKVKGNAPLYTTQPETPLRAAISAMAEHDIGSLIMLKRHARYLPVLEARTLMGVISFYDVAKAVVEANDFENRMLKAYIRDWP